MPLKLSLRPHETIVVNGAVVQNGDRRGVLLLQNQARILREKDLMSAAEARTPAQRAYFTLMLFYLSGEEAGPALTRLQEALRTLAADPGTRGCAEEISALIVVGQTYRALGLARALIARTAAGEVL